MHSVAIILPVLNEEKNLEHMLPKIKAMKSFSSANASIIVVDGNSKDNSVRVAEQHGCTVIHQQGKGYGNAIKEGMDAACRNHDYLIKLDPDGTYSVNDLEKVIDALDSNDFIITNRLNLWKTREIGNYFGNITLSVFISMLLDIPFVDTQSGLYATSSKFYQKIRDRLTEHGFLFSQEFKIACLKQGGRFKEMEIEYLNREHGETKLSFARKLGLVLGSIRMVGRFS